MNIAIICGSLSRGGAERVTIQLGKYFAEQNNNVFIITAALGKNEYDLPENINRIVLSESYNSINALLSSIKKLRFAINNNNIDIVIIMGVPLCLYAIPGCLGTNAKVIVSERNDPTHFAGKKITKWISRFLMKKADGFVFQTEDAKNFYKRKLKSDSVIIPNPLLFENFPEPYNGEREKIIVNVGRLDPQKNQKLLIRAFAQISNEIPDYKLVIYGEGKLRQELNELIVSLKISDRVLLPGNVMDLHERIKKAAVFVLSSDFEGMPNALIEAMALGLPCISTDCPCGGPRALIKHGENGYLVPVGDSNILSKMLKEILTNNSISSQISLNATTVRNQLNIDIIGSLWMEYLNK